MAGLVFTRPSPNCLHPPTTPRPTMATTTGTTSTATTICTTRTTATTSAPAITSTKATTNMPTATAPRKKNLTEQQRHQILWLLARDSTGGNSRHGAIGAAADQFEVQPRTVSRIWQRAVASAAATGVLQVPSRKCATGRKKKDYGAALERLREAAPEMRSTSLGYHPLRCTIGIAQGGQEIIADQAGS
ncbi:hypothetical protein PHYSODRAFT_299662 [Phytophthora sojae]|uniref:DUF7769 domain-containing protein n=1 Tax=Phytophthora sojae (strain P6497) TaxID=1094619 RepID=G4Z4W2_PHYSP|nr:hypothetical protein PHYSODRAFT_299662 [Phytophthora sojae]EGZ22291.1 hypothetical protein PHYSODRAFT_299662 [Phytophthora sojae]|eukprot:XP_009525008.1 hypothetical protein PHYSODRAFT_299662 [Phytophthora sojae]